MKEAIFVTLRVIVLIFALLGHLVKFLWSGMIILPITLIDSWIATMYTEKVISKKMFSNVISVVFEGDAIFDMLKWLFDEE